MGKPPSESRVSSSESRVSSSVISFAQARKIAEEHGTPTLVCDLKVVEANYKRLKAAMPKCQPYYAVKANPLPEILKALVKLGSCFDVASKNEILMAFDAGAAPDRLIYANPVKPKESLKFAYDHDVRTYTFDNPAEVEKIAKYAPGSDVVLRLAVRDLGSVCKFSTKFGAKEKDALSLLKKAESMGLNALGMAFHVGSQCVNIDNYASALEMCGRIYRAAQKKGIEMSVVDIGGGIPIKYIDDIYSVEDVARLVNARIAEIFPEGIRLISEPGRYLAGECMTLVTRVVGVAERNKKRCIYIDDGCYNSLSERIFGHCEYEILSNKAGSKHRYTVFGPTCDSMDVVAKECPLPNMNIGDLLLVPNAGAYTNAAATHFNGFDPAKILFI